MCDKTDQYLKHLVASTLSSRVLLFPLCAGALFHQLLIICLLLGTRKRTVKYTSAPMMPVSYSPAPVMQVHCVYACGAGILCMCIVCMNCIFRYNAWSVGTVV